MNNHGELQEENPKTLLAATCSLDPIDLMTQAQEYYIDSWQRSFLFLDVLRQRGNASMEQEACLAPNALQFKSEVLIDGRNLKKPVNYILMKILPFDEITPDPLKRPFVVFDPRAGQGPGIGGMKKGSEIGIALENGHPVYFVSFLPKPVKGQTVEDVCEAEAHFITKILEWHPAAEKPCLIGNCQAGWQIALMSALHPELAGVLILAAAPLSYWSGKRGKSPGRYAGGLTGGSWLNAFLSDIGNGLFDGAWLVSTFENNDPSHAFWKKSYNVYSKIDTETPRYLAFERWWGSPTFLGREEMQFISDELFIGNHLSTAKIHSSTGFRADLRNIKSPLVIFCSRGDDITPPAQALGWIPELYSTEQDIIASEQTIIYCLHNSIGHLGIFVSTSVAAKEHQKFISNIDMIEALPPGLYEAVFIPKAESEINSGLVSGDYILRFERRSIDDIRAFGVNDAEDDRRFQTVARLSENIHGVYSTFLSPLVRACVTEESAEMLRANHPVRLPFQLFSDNNPMCQTLPDIAAAIQEQRQPVAENNLFLQMQNTFSDQISTALDTINEAKNESLEMFFLDFFGNPMLQAMLGLRTDRPHAQPAPSRDVQIEHEHAQKIKDTLALLEKGGLTEAMIRGILYVSHIDGAVDEREYKMLVRLKKESNLLPSLSQPEYKIIVRLQHTLLLLDEDKTVNAIPKLLTQASSQAKQAMKVIRDVISATGTPSTEQESRLKRLETLFMPS